jgi:quinoprotein glucose dehydrogenase
VGHGPKARGEIWAYGFRNPWRIAFDRETGLLWAGDVGQDEWEEIDIVKRGGNYGWNLREGFHKFGPVGSEPREGLIEPIFEYHHTIGKSITGGTVYRGKKIPELQGKYIYADYVTGKVWALAVDPETHQATGNHLIGEGTMPIITFGEDRDGEMYFSTDNHVIYRLVPSSSK